MWLYCILYRPGLKSNIKLRGNRTTKRQTCSSQSLSWQFRHGEHGHGVGFQWQILYWHLRKKESGEHHAFQDSDLFAALRHFVMMQKDFRAEHERIGNPCQTVFPEQHVKLLHCQAFQTDQNLLISDEDTINIASNFREISNTSQ